MHGVACLDLWGIMMKAAGWEGNREELVGSKMRERSEVLGDLLRDGAYALLVFWCFGEGCMEGAGSLEGGKARRTWVGGVENC